MSSPNQKKYFATRDAISTVQSQAKSIGIQKKTTAYFANTPQTCPSSLNKFFKVYYTKT